MKALICPSMAWGHNHVTQIMKSHPSFGENGVTSGICFCEITGRILERKMAWK